MRRDLALTWMQLALAMVLLGSSAPVGKIVVEAFPPVTATILRLLFVNLALLPSFLAMKTAPVKIDRRTGWIIAAIAVLAGIGFNLFLLTGVKMVPASTAALVMSAGPAVTAIGSVMFTGDRWTRLKVIGVALGVIGAGLAQVSAAEGSGRASLLGLALLVGAVVCQAAFTLLGQMVRDEHSALRSLTLANALALPLALPLLLIERPWTMDLAPTSLHWAAMLWWGVIGAAVGSVLWYRAVDRVSGSVAGGFSAVNPLAGLLLSYVLLAEPVKGAQLLGMAVAILGILLIARAHRREVRKAEGAE